MFGNLTKRLSGPPRLPGVEATEESKHPAKCGCRRAKRHRDCAYCGFGWDAGKVCGACRQAGIDGQVIRGTESRTCAEHRREKS